MNELEYIPIETAWLVTEKNMYYVELKNAEHLSHHDTSFEQPTGFRCEIRHSNSSSQQFREEDRPAR